MKLTGAVLILLSALYAGIKLNRELKLRCSTLSSLAYAFELMSADMGSGQCTTRQALILAGERTGGAAGEFLKSIGEEIGCANGRELSDIWRDKLSGLSMLSDEDKDEIVRLGEALGAYCAQDEREHLIRSSEYFRCSAQKAGKKLDELKKINLALPVSLAAAVIIVLV